MAMASRLWRDRSAFPGVLLFCCAFLVPAAVPWVGPLGSAQAAEVGEVAVPFGKGGTVIIRGNQRIEPETIIAYMQLPTDRQITAEDLNLAVRRLFDTGLFKDVRIVPRDGQLVVEVRENPWISRISFEGNKILSDEDLQKIVRLRPRLPFTRSAAEADAQRIVEVYRRIGRYAATVEPKIIERSENRVDVAFEIKEGPIAEVKSIKFIGNRAFSDRRLRRVIETKEAGLFSFIVANDTFDPDRFELDKELLRQFYLKNGYADFTIKSATAEFSPEQQGFFISFVVDEGEQYRFGKMDVHVSTRGLDAEEFRAHLPADIEGKVYDGSLVETVADELTDLAAQKGYAFVQVRPLIHKDTESRIIDVTFELREGSRIFVERIDIEGNTQTLDRVIRREMQLVEGDAFDARKVRVSRNRIRALGFFKKVDIETVQGSAPDRAVLKIKVEDQPTGSLSLGVGLSSSTGIVGNVAVTERNFLGRGQTVRFQLAVSSDTRTFDFAFIEPRFLDRDLSVGMTASYQRDDRRDQSSFDVDTGIFRPEVGFPLSAHLRFTGNYELRRDKIDAATGASAAIQADDGIWYRSGVGYSLFYDRRNDPIEPTSGYIASLDQSVTGLGGDSRYVSQVVRFKTWKGFFDKQLVASAELEAGAILGLGKDPRVTERFFLGGQTFRGFAPEGLGPRDLATDDTLGGKYYGVARFEVSFPLGLPEELGVFGGAFMDVGTLFGLDRTDFPGSNIIDDPKLRLSVGGLLFLNTPVGPLELSLGHPLIRESYDDKELFRLTVGTRF